MTENKGKNKGHENLIPCKPGETANPNGRPKGQRNYSTIYREALIKLATINDMNPEEMETDILFKGLSFAHKGDYRFWKDLHDRLHGTATNNIDILSGGEKMEASTIVINSQGKDPDVLVHE